MALVNCEECGSQVSDRAAACPKCGCPIGSKAEPEEHEPVEIEQTGKNYKLGMLVGGAVFLGGILFLAKSDNPAVGIALTGIGAVAYIVAKLGAWWDNG